MKTPNLSQMVILSLLFLALGCGKGGGSSSSGSGESDSGKKSNSSGFNLGGSITRLDLIFPIQSFAAATPTCTNFCNLRINTCASLFEIGESGVENWLCDTEVNTEGQYQFNFSNRAYFRNKKLKIKVNSYKGQPREATIEINGDETLQSSVDINPITTLESIFKTDDISNGKETSDGSGQLLRRDLKLMCPAFINDTNVDDVIRNALGYMASSFSKNLLIEFRKRYQAGSDLSGLTSDISTFCNYIASALEIKESGIVKLQLTDKKSIPYRNLRFWLAKHNGFLDESAGDGAFYTTDSNGYIEITDLPNAGYSFILAEPTTDPDVFLWASNWKYSGHIEKISGISNFQMQLPRVLLYEKSPYTVAPDLVGPQKKYYAQSFTVTTKTSFCGVGFGMGLGGRGSPSSLQIRRDNQGIPEGTTLYESSVLKFTGAVSYNNEAGYANICEKLSGSGELLPGKYWVIARYENITLPIAVLGDESEPQNLSNFKVSDDGLNWEDSNILVSWPPGQKIFQRLAFYLTE